MPFSELGLADQLVQGILATGYTAPTAIQSRAIPFAISGRDIIGCAQTGTGKTAAFVLPMLNHFLNHPASQKGHHTRGLVLTPTRELAQQVEEFVTGYARFTSLHSTAVFGGVSMENQIKRLRRGVDIVVATPGRLLDHMNRRTVDLSHVEILVVDEADRMFDMGFIQDVRKIISRVPAKRQTLLFSATMSKEVKDLVASIQTNPELIEIGERRKPVETVKQHFYSSPQDSKMELLLHILQAKELDCVLVFSRTKHGADKISHRLERGGIKSVAIHSNRTQAQRQRALAGFKQGQYKVMVATDIAARGIDVEGISHVINYDTPTFAEDYIHRIGRTGRASATGDAITFVSNQELKYLKSIERYTDKKFELKRYPTFDYSKRPAPQEKQHSSKSSEDRREQPHGKRDGRRDHHRKDASRKPYREQRQGDLAGKSRSDRPHSHSSEKPKYEHRSPDSSGKQRNEKHSAHSPRPSQNDQRLRKPFGSSMRGNESREQQRDTTRRPSFGTGKSPFPKKQPAAPQAPRTQETDWRTLVAEMDEGGGLKKKLKKLFIRDKA